MLLELYPELEGYTEVEIERYTQEIYKGIYAVCYEIGYLEAVAQIVRKLKYKTEDEPLFAAAIVKIPYIMWALPQVYHTLRLWQVLFLTSSSNSEQLIEIIKKIPKKLNNKLFDEDNSLILLSNLLHSYYSTSIISQHIPTKYLRSHEFLEKALAHGIPFEMLDKFIKLARLDITSELAQHYITHLDTNTKDIAYIPADVRQKVITAAVAKKVIRLNPELTQYIPAAACDEALYLQVVKHSGKLVKYAAKDKVTRKIYEAALKNDVDSMIYIPEELRDIELFTIAVKADPIGLRYVPDEIQTAELVQMAVKKNPMSLRYVADNLITNEVCTLAVANDYVAYKLIPNEFKTKAITNLAAKHADTKAKMRALIRFIPEVFVPDYSHLL